MASTDPYADATPEAEIWARLPRINVVVEGWQVGKPRDEVDAAWLRDAGFAPLPGWPPAAERTVDQVDADRYRWGTR